MPSRTILLALLLCTSVACVSLSEREVRVPLGDSGAGTLVAMVYRPSGVGPFRSS